MKNLQFSLKNLNTKYNQVTDLMPNYFNFGDKPDTYSSDMTDFSYFGWANAICVQADGKVVVGGVSGLYDNVNNYSILKRFNTDGSLDNTFTSVQFYNGNDGHIRDIKQQSDGKLVVVGHFNNVDGGSHHRIVRLNTDGTVDNTFDMGTGFNGTALVIKILADDSMLIGGTFGSYAGTSSDYLVKLNSDGTIDNSFISNINFDDYVFAIEEDANNDIYVGGYFTNYIVRLNSDGTTDNGFNVGGGFNGRVNTIKIQGDGKIVVGGWFNNYDSTAVPAGIARLNTDGTLDLNFSTEGSGFNGWDDTGGVQDLAIQSNGKIVVGGWFVGINDTTKLGRIARLNTDGSLDTGFVTGLGFSDRVQRIELDASGNILCVGFFYSYNNKNCTNKFNYCGVNSKFSGGVAKLTSSGTLLGTPVVHGYKTNGDGLYTSGINDGGNDMWDGGAYFNTDIAGQTIPFTHSVGLLSDVSDEDYVLYNRDTDMQDNAMHAMDATIVNGVDYFGSGSTYFTNVYPGMLVLAANKISIDEFNITGGTGQDGDGDYDSGYVEVIVNQKLYTVFYKTSYDNYYEEPSINHLIIVDGAASGINQNFNDPTDSDDHYLTGLTGREELFVVIFGRMDQTASTEQEITNIAKKFLTIVTTAEPIYSCSDLACERPSFKCLTTATNKCSCRRWRLFYPNCTRANIASGMCNGLAGAYVPAITVCNQRLF